MAANNMIMLIGRLGRDPELRFAQNGTTAIATFSLAVDRPGRRDAQGNRTTDWFNVKLFGKQAELANDMLRKGARASVVGACHQEKWEKDGQRQERTVVSADSFQILDSRTDGSPEPAAPRLEPAPAPPASTYFDDDDIPPF